MLEHVCAELRRQLVVLSFYHAGPRGQTQVIGFGTPLPAEQLAGFLHAFFMTLTWKKFCPAELHIF